jgi:hypothetical protein
MVTIPVATYRQPLNLPAGSIRALLVLMVLGLIWALMLLPEESGVQIPLYLFYLMFLLLGHFFAAHGHSISGPRTGARGPLYLPRGTLRVLIIGGFAVVLGYRYYTYHDVNKLLALSPPPMEEPYLPLVLIGAFFLGIFVGRVLGGMLSGPTGTPPWFQDVQSWFALVAGLGLGVELVIQFIINPSLNNKIYLPNAQMVLAAIIAFYFGARS